MIDQVDLSIPKEDIVETKAPEKVSPTTNTVEAPKPAAPKVKSSGLKLPSMADITSGTYKVKRDEEKEENVDLPMQAFSPSEFLSTWEECLQALRSKNLTSLNVMLQSIELEQKTEVCWTVFFPNKIQYEIFQGEKVNILTFLREKLQNYSIDFALEIREGSTKLTPYTNAEKFRAMAESNPVLLELKNKLGLDLG